MDSELLNEYVGKIIIVQFDKEKYSNVPLAGELLSYDENFIKINYYVEVFISNLGSKEQASSYIIRMRKEGINKKTVLGKGSISRIEELAIGS